MTDRYVQRQPETAEDYEIVRQIREALLASGDNPDEWGNGLGMINLDYVSPFTLEEEEDVQRFLHRTDAALGFMQNGEKISYGVGIDGMVFERD